jgi:hypothetical protein
VGHPKETLIHPFDFERLCVKGKYRKFQASGSTARGISVKISMTSFNQLKDFVKQDALKPLIGLWLTPLCFVLQNCENTTNTPVSVNSVTKYS